VLEGLILILKDFLEVEDWSPPEELKEMLLCSALLPVLEAAFQSGSLLEMGKDINLYFAYLDLIRVIAS